MRKLPEPGMTRATDIEHLEGQLRSVLRQCNNAEDAITVALLFVATVFHPVTHEFINEEVRPDIEAIHRHALDVLNRIGCTRDLTVN